MESERENYVSWWRERNSLPGGSRGHTPLSFSSALHDERPVSVSEHQRCFSRHSGDLWCSSWSSPVLVTAVLNHERNSRRKSRLDSLGCEPPAETLRSKSRGKRIGELIERAIWRLCLHEIVAYVLIEFHDQRCVARQLLSKMCHLIRKLRVQKSDWCSLPSAVTSEKNILDNKKITKIHRWQANAT